MNQALNPFTAQNFGAPPPPQGPMGLFMPRRKLISAAYLPTRWERLKIRGWWPYRLAVPSAFPGIFSVDGQDTQEFSASPPVYFCLAGFSVFLYPYPGGNINQTPSVSVELYHPESNQALVNPNGPPLNVRLLGGTAKSPFWFKEFFFLDPGDTLLARVANLGTIAQQGQIVADGYQPLLFGVSDAPQGPPPGVPFFELHGA